MSLSLRPCEEGEGWSGCGFISSGWSVSLLQGAMSVMGTRHTSGGSIRKGLIHPCCHCVPKEALVCEF